MTLPAENVSREVGLQSEVSNEGDAGTMLGYLLPETREIQRGPELVMREECLKVRFLFL